MSLLTFYCQVRAIGIEIVLRSIKFFWGKKSVSGRFCACVNFFFSYWCDEHFTADVIIYRCCNSY